MNINFSVSETKNFWLFNKKENVIDKRVTQYSA